MANEKLKDKCIMPECPYCPACEHGSVIPAGWVETTDDLSTPGAVSWHCDLEEGD